MSDVNHRVRKQIMGYIVSQSISAVCELGVPDRLADGACLLGDLAASVGADADALGRFLRVLVAEGLFAEVGGGRFALTEAGELLRADAPGSLRHLVGLMSNEAYLVWGHAAHSIRTGKESFSAAFGKPYFEWLSENPSAADEFARGQAGLVELRLLPLLDHDWSDVGTVVDVGGGTGALITRLLDRHAHLRGILFDLPHVVAEAPSTFGSAGIGERTTVVGGSFFDDVPGNGDVYVLSQILHDWDDASAGKILSSCRQAIPPGGRLMIVEQVLPESATTHPMALLDLHMLVLLGGRERTITEWRRLLTDHGFTLDSITQGPRSSVIEAVPV
ncbi:methyltransferase [Rhodococcus opacus]|nr:methyltransferase [Rhodococcus opacus]NDV06479.1 methyltransferase [Rhodococcus sp. IEGM 248]NHU43204.1 methyltransferase [Rhodococcus sp. A14]NKY75345.1 methyltransferase [Rhodococcus opacus]QZS59795.1 methyltransferase [Rhodococcus opacus]RKM73148.1 methyltransferase [Rhodococcus opacus]